MCSIQESDTPVVPDLPEAMDAVGMNAVGVASSKQHPQAHQSPVPRHSRAISALSLQRTPQEMVAPKIVPSLKRVFEQEGDVIRDRCAVLQVLPELSLTSPMTPTQVVWKIRQEDVADERTFRRWLNNYKAGDKREPRLREAMETGAPRWMGTAQAWRSLQEGQKILILDLSLDVARDLEDTNRRMRRTPLHMTPHKVHIIEDQAPGLVRTNSAESEEL